MRIIFGLAAMALLLGPSGPISAQDAYPSRPIHWIVPFPPGGPTDTLSRVLAAKLADTWKPGIVIDNKGGAAGAIGVEFAAKAAPDGYTIQLGTQSTNASNKIFYPNLPYDPINDFEPLTLLAGISYAKPDVSKQVDEDGPWEDFHEQAKTSLRLPATLEQHGCMQAIKSRDWLR